jgi:cytochrome c oxidase subunit IV
MLLAPDRRHVRSAMVLAAASLDRLRLQLMGWATIVLVMIGIAGLLGANCIHLGRR